MVSRNASSLFVTIIENTSKTTYKDLSQWRTCGFIGGEETRVFEEDPLVSPGEHNSSNILMPGIKAQAAFRKYYRVQLQWNPMDIVTQSIQSVTQIHVLYVKEEIVQYHWNTLLFMHMI